MSKKRKTDSKTLRLRRETVRNLVSLDDTALAGVVGGYIRPIELVPPPRTGACTTQI